MCLIMIVFYLFVFKYTKSNSNFGENKFNIVKIQGIFIMTFRVFIIKNLSEISLVALNINDYLIFIICLVTSLLVIL